MIQSTELQRIIEGINLLRAHGSSDALAYQGGLFVAIPLTSLSRDLVVDMRALGWLWHEHSVAIVGFFFQLSPL